MESKGEGKYDDDDDDAKSGSTRDAKSESKEQDEQDDALLRRVFDWYYEDEDLEAELQKFAFDHAKEFEDECSSTGEYSLEHTELHREFRSIFERRLEEERRAAWKSVSDFYRLVASDQARSTELYSGHTFAVINNRDVLRVVLRTDEGCEARRLLLGRAAVAGHGHAGVSCFSVRPVPRFVGRGA